ncbi:hypothetical protein HQQ81_19650 [Microbacteriaceae bacterium VKM Ac-2854]|nr:hypothetical protein [Microbacteriaceae bacterium VKM Ac-2854]
MTTQTPPSSDDTTTPGLKRRTVATAAAWTVPAIAVAVGAPAASASGNKVGYVTVDPHDDFVRPGDTYPLITITLHRPAPDNSVVNTTNATVTVILPAGYTWADGTPATPTGRVFPNVAGGILELKDVGNGTNYAVVAAQDPAGLQTGGTITASAVDATPATGNPTSYTDGSATITTAYNGTGGTASGAIWADNTNFKALSLEGYQFGPNPVSWATPVDAVSGVGNGDILDFTAAGPSGTFLVQKTGSGATTSTRIWATHTGNVAMTTTNWQYLAFEIIIPSGRLRTGEYVVQVSASLEVLTNFGRVFSFASPNGVNDEFPEYTFPVAAGQPQPFVQEVVGTRYGQRPGNMPYWSIARDANGDVWSLSKLGSPLTDPSWAGDGQTHAKLYTPVKVVGVSNVVEISAGVAAGMARTASGQVFTWGDNQSGFNVGGNGYVGGLPPIVKLGQTSQTDANNFGTVSVVAADGNLYSWGSDYYAQNNSNNTTQGSLAVSGVTLNHTMDATRGSRKVVDVANVGPSTAVILDDNTVWAWGIGGTQDGAGGYVASGPNNPAQSTTPLRVQRWKASWGTPPVDHFATKFFDSNYQTYATDSI